MSYPTVSGLDFRLDSSDRLTANLKTNLIHLLVGSFWPSSCHCLAAAASSAGGERREAAATAACRESSSMCS